MLSNVNFTEKEPFTLSFRDRIFTVAYSLLDYRNPSAHEYQHYLEGFDADWSIPASLPVVRYSDLAPGHYTLHIRGRSGQGEWSEKTRSIPIVITPALYQRPWFWPLVVLLATGLITGLMQYRLYLLNRRSCRS
ncbi:MAG: triple tyrosine motif-containing protein [Saprospiraceae bacterium]